jgi:hypothetical protein
LSGQIVSLDSGKLTGLPVGNPLLRYPFKGAKQKAAGARLRRQGQTASVAVASNGAAAGSRLGGGRAGIRWETREAEGDSRGVQRRWEFREPAGARWRRAGAGAERLSIFAQSVERDA